MTCVIGKLACCKSVWVFFLIVFFSLLVSFFTVEI